MTDKFKWSKRAQKEHRAKWLAALRSDEYAQTKGKLTNGKGFCCLGLACEISGLGVWEDGPEGEWVYNVDGYKSDQALPEPVRNWLGLDNSPGYYCDGGLADLNDDGKKFKTIADIIESEPEGLLAGSAH